MTLIFLFFTGFLIGITGAMIPGPLTLFTVSEVLKENRFSGIKIVFGHIAIESIIVFSIFAGLHSFLRSDKLLFITSLAGGISLAMMGLILILQSGSMKPFSKENKNEHSSRGLFFGGVLFSVASPGFIIWWATIGISTVMRALIYGLIGIVVLSLGHWMADLLWYWSLSYALDRGKGHLSVNTFQNILRALSLGLIILGLYFILSVFYI